MQRAEGGIRRRFHGFEVRTLRLVRKSNRHPSTVEECYQHPNTEFPTRLPLVALSSRSTHRRPVL
jgi:hypothetical protein